MICISACVRSTSRVPRLAPLRAATKTDKRRGMTEYKIPESVLVVIHTAGCDVLLLERADHPGFGQSVTGSRDSIDEPFTQTCRREVLEETGIDCLADDVQLTDWQQTNRFAIFKHWANRFAPGTTHNTEHVFGLLLPDKRAVTIAPDEHLRYQWLGWREAIDVCFSWTNVAAIRQLPERVAGAAGVTGR